jgi:hypothetical protein
MDYKATTKLDLKYSLFFYHDKGWLMICCSLLLTEVGVPVSPLTYALIKIGL